MTQTQCTHQSQNVSATIGELHRIIH